jgi:DNA modification methylase
VVEIVEATVSELRVNPRNPRRIRPERMAQLMRTMVAERRWLGVRPVVARRDTKEVIAGNHRVLAAIELEWETIATAFLDVDEVEATTLMLLDNQQFAEDDDDLVAVILAELEERGGDLDLTGFERAETERLLRRLAYNDKDPDALPELPTCAPDSKPGTVYELGRHRVMCGDATNPHDVNALLDGAEPTVVTTDPPYGVELDNRWRDRVGVNGSGRGRTTEHVGATLASDDRSDWSEAYALVPSLQVAYVWHASRHACDVQAGLERVGFELRQQIIWHKGLFVLSRQDYHWAHEPCFYAVRAGERPAWLGSRSQSTVWEAASPKMVAAAGRDVGDQPVDHPAQKPVALYTRPIENHLQPGESVYDPFAGSGTAIIAAELTGRVCFALELDPRCVDLIRARFQGFTSGC